MSGADEAHAVKRARDALRALGVGEQAQVAQAAVEGDEAEFKLRLVEPGARGDGKAAAVVCGLADGGERGSVCLAANFDVERCGPPTGQQAQACDPERALADAPFQRRPHLRHNRSVQTDPRHQTKITTRARLLVRRAARVDAPRLPARDHLNDAAQIKRQTKLTRQHVRRACGPDAEPHACADETLQCLVDRPVAACDDDLTRACAGRFTRQARRIMRRGRVQHFDGDAARRKQRTEARDLCGALPAAAPCVRVRD